MTFAAGPLMTNDFTIEYGRYHGQFARTINTPYRLVGARID
jgi:hypothetical protein